ncbi:MAG: hypothetical protein DRP60_11225, partial [Spirochaetes bacterium]
MIVPMKKVSLVILEKDRKVSLKRLRAFGVMHLEAKPVGSGEQLDSLQAIQSRVISAIAKLDTSVKGEKLESKFQRGKTLELVDDTLELDRNIKNLHTSIDKVSAQIEMLKPYGEFEPADLDILRSKGVDIRLFDADDSIMPGLEESGAVLFELKRKKKNVIFAAVFSGEASREAIEMSVELPEYGIAELRGMHRDMSLELSDLQQKLIDRSKLKLYFEYLLTEIEQDLEFEALVTGTEGEESLIWVSGFIPEDEIPGIRELAAVEGWGLLVRDPDPEDNIPTLVKNGPKIRIIKPVFDFLGTLPGYKEYDISLYFLAYFTVFFAMIVGDAGYGLIFFFGAVFLAFKSRKSSSGLPDAVKLLFLLSLATV